MGRKSNIMKSMDAKKGQENEGRTGMWRESRNVELKRGI